MIVRRARIFDLSQMHEVENLAWGNSGAPIDTIEHRLNIASNYTVVAEEGCKILAFLTLLRIKEFDINSFAGSWKSTVGSFENAFDPNGNLLYGVSLSSRPHQPVASRCVFEAGLALTVDSGCKAMTAAGRIPHYYKWANTFSADDYLRLVILHERLYYLDNSTILLGPHRNEAARHDIAVDGRIDPSTWKEINRRQTQVVREKAEHLDPHLRFYKGARCAGIPVEFLKAVPDYFHDPASLSFGAQYVWYNPFYSKC